ncbi:MAG: GNAT family N-acetyltransferase [Cyclobacteriaceae bacterium]|nr:GNAT family N-acetyltransferase [Cyclobacteriaceae bacterium]
MSAVIEPYDPEGLYDDPIKSFIRSIRINDHHLPPTATFDTDLLDIEAYYLKRNGMFWIARSAYRIVGTIAVVPAGDGVFVLRKMFVDPEFRGSPHYLAKQLLDVFLDFTTARNARIICLGTSSSYVRANGFYLKSGFTKMPDDQFPTEFKNPLDDIFYQKVMRVD